MPIQQILPVPLRCQRIRKQQPNKPARSIRIIQPEYCNNEVKSIHAVLSPFLRGKRNNSPATLTSGSSTSNPLRANCNRLKFTLSGATSPTRFNAANNSLNRGGTFFPALTTEDDAAVVNSCRWLCRPCPPRRGAELPVLVVLVVLMLVRW